MQRLTRTIYFNNYLGGNLPSRFAFNGMEKDDEMKGGGNAYTTEFREYDPRVGRWFSVDPKNLNLPWESPYISMGNNSITRIDKHGDKWKDEADKKKADDISSQLEQRKNTLQKKADELLKQAHEIKLKGKDDKANKILAKAENYAEGAKQLAKAQNEIAEMGTSPTEFAFKEKNSGNISYTYMDDHGTIIMEYSSDANAVHELTHGYQHISGQIDLNPESQKSYSDLTDEQTAYLRQYFFEPYSVQSLNSDAGTVTTFKDITTDFVKNIWTSDDKGKIVYPYMRLESTPLNKPNPPSKH